MAKSIGDNAQLEVLGNNIAQARGRRTQSDIAAASGIDISTISDLENGRRNPSYTTLLQLAKAMGVAVEELVREQAVPLESRIAALEKALQNRVPAPKPRPAPKRKTKR